MSTNSNETITLNMSTNSSETTTSNISTNLALNTTSMPANTTPQSLVEENKRNKSFFAFAPEIRNKIYSHVAESRTGKGQSLNDIRIPGLFFACWATLREGLGILLNLNYIPRLTLFNTDRRNLFNMYSIHTYHAMRPGTKALLQAAGDSARIQAFTSYICIGDPTAVRAQINGSHVVHSLVIEMDQEGKAKVYFKFRVGKGREEEINGITETIQKALDVRLKKRELKGFEFDDFELVLSAVKTYSACWCPSKISL